MIDEDVFLFIVIIAMIGSRKNPRVEKKAASFDEVEQSRHIDSEQEEDQSIFLKEVNENKVRLSNPIASSVGHSQFFSVAY